MSSPIGIRDVLWHKANSLATNIRSLSDSLPKDEIYELKIRLNHCVASIPNYLISGFEKERRIDKIRAFIHASSQLEECRSYLNMIENLRYADVKELKRQVDEMVGMLKLNSGTFN